MSLQQAFIRALELEYLLKHHSIIESLLQSLVSELEAFMQQQFSESELIETLSMGNRVLTDVPRVSSPDPGAKMTRIVQNLPGQVDRLKLQGCKEIIDDINTVDLTLKKLEITLRALTKEERQIMQLYFLEGHTWEQVADKMQMSLLQVKQRRKRAIERLVPVTRISLSDYRRIVELIEGNR
ncbi:MAG TPA: sigma factor-like helix-turn-helix DNA-binding protein [Syntrophomonas sp.]|nr:sigma factor-like helix-turn-helix DNA-binding protein [Syntrophomonas sp.]